MAWIEPVSAGITALELANDLAKSSSFIRKHAHRILFLIKNGSVVLPIFGSGGTGKSTASRIIAGADPLDINSAYEESSWLETVQLQGDVPGTILVPPGQTKGDRVDKHWPALYRYLTKGRSSGFVNVVAYGYHSLKINTFIEHDIYKEGDDIYQFFAKYLELKRDAELAMLQKVIDGLSAVSDPLWMVTLVNKQDLWHNKQNEVRNYYESGPYAEKINIIRAMVGKRNFQHETVPVSLTIGNLVTGSGEILAPTVSGYDLPTHLSYLNSMFGTVSRLIEHGHE